MYESIKGLAGIEERAENSTVIVDKISDSFTKTVNSVNRGAATLESKLKFRGGQKVKVDEFQYMFQYF